MSGLLRLDRRHRGLRNTLLAILGLTVVVLVVARISARYEPTRFVHDTPITSVPACITAYRPTVQPSPVTIDALTQLDVFCFNMLAKQLRVEEQVGRNDALEVQKFENIVMLWMVVAITVSGVGLAGLQLLGSYELAKAGREKFMGDATDLSYTDKNVAVKSSVVGVIILTISFAFFLVFVIYLHPVKQMEMVAVPVPPPPASPSPSLAAPPATEPGPPATPPPAGPQQSGPMVPLAPQPPGGNAP